jgi:hypothetical protein
MSHFAWRAAIFSYMTPVARRREAPRREFFWPKVVVSRARSLKPALK